MEVAESLLVEEGVYGVGHLVPHAEYGSERVGAGTQVGYLAQELHGVSFLLKRIGLRVGGAVHFECFGLYFGTLSFAL